MKILIFLKFICPRIVKGGCIGPRQFLKLLNTHFKSVENITDGWFVAYITGCGKHPFLNTFINQSISVLGNLHSF
jgi:hypothetical protein